MEKLKAILVGCGRISYKHIESLLYHEDNIALYGLADIEVEKAPTKKQEYLSKVKNNKIEVKATHNYEELLEDKNVDIVIIATESGKHSEISLKALSKGKHVMVEKLMALSTEDAEKMINVAKENNVKLCVCHQNRFNPPIIKLKKAIERLRFGKVFAITARILWNRNEEYYKQAPWRGTYDQDGGCLFNQCIHNIDLLLWMMNKNIKEVNGMMGNFIHPYIEAEDYGSIQIRFEDESIGNVEGTVNVYPQNMEETLSVFGEKGTVVIGGKAVNKVLVWEFEDKEDSLIQIHQECNEEIENVYGSGHIPIYSNFIQSIVEDEILFIDGEEGKKAVELILNAYRSNELKARVYY